VQAKNSGRRSFAFSVQLEGAFYRHDAFCNRKQFRYIAAGEQKSSF
jgi:hypothetical protein